jgi:hypothetical protein
MAHLLALGRGVGLHNKTAKVAMSYTAITSALVQ